MAWEVEILGKLIMFACRCLFEIGTRDPTRLLSYHIRQFKDDDNPTTGDPTQRLVRLAKSTHHYLTVAEAPAGHIMSLTMLANTILVAIIACL